MFCLFDKLHRGWLRVAYRMENQGSPHLQHVQSVHGCFPVGSLLSKPQQRWQRECHKIKSLMSKTRAAQVSFFAVLCKTTTSNDQVLHCLRNVDDEG